MIVFLILVLAVVPSVGVAADRSAESSPFVPNVKPVLGVKQLEGRIQIDGFLDDDGWVGASLATNFAETQPGDQVRPPVGTEVLVTYDQTHLYIAFRAYDSRPAQIRASLRARDEIFDDDFVGVVIDTYGNAAWAYELFVNPYGIQGDMRWTPGGEDIGFDVVFESRGRITDEGYQVELAVPFKSLRFPNRPTQDWRATFIRVHPRDSERHYSWAAISRDDPCYPCQFGTLSGMSGVRSGSSFELLPGIVGGQTAELSDPSDPSSGFDEADPDADLSLGVRYAFTPSTSAELSINPDFSQVESDVAQIDVNTTFALFFPERRPFFQEGSDLYDSWHDVIYTRQINDPLIAVKATTRSDRTSFVYLFGRDEETPMILPFEERSLFAAPGKSYANILRARYAFKEDSYAGVMFTDRRYDIGGSGTVGGFDGSYRFAQNYRIEAQGLLSYTDEPDDPSLTAGAANADTTFADGKHTAALDGETYTGHAVYLSLERDARHWNSDIDYWDTGATFRADLGFVRRNSSRRVSWYNNYIFYPDNRVFDRIRFNILPSAEWNSFGAPKRQALENWVDLVLKGQISFVFGYDNTNENFRNVDFEDIDLYYMEFNTNYFARFQFGFWLGVGDRVARTAQPQPFLGDGEHLDVWVTLRIGNRFVLEPLFTYSTIRDKDTGADFFRGYITRTKFNYQFTRELFLRFVLQYDDFDGVVNVEPLLSYELNPFTVFYVGANVNGQDFDHKSFDPLDRTGDGFEPTSWQYFFKFQYFYRY